MKQGARLRLIVAAVLFIGWLGWLTYLAATATRPVVLSRPQILVADAHVVALVADGEEGKPARTVTIQEVISAPGQKGKLAPGAELDIAGLEECGPEQGWAEAGKYLLPLTKTSDGSYMLTMIPVSPGYLPELGAQRLRIYPATAQTLQQLSQFLPDRQ